MEFETWLCTQDTENEKRPATIAGYVRDVALYAEWYTALHHEPLTPDRVRRSDVMQYRDELAATHKPASVNRRLAAVQAYVRYGWATGVLATEVDPFANLKRVQQVQQSPRCLSNRDWNRLVEVAYNQSQSRRPGARLQGVRDFAVLLLLQRAGLRVSELCSLTLLDVQLAPDRGLVVVRDGKGGKWREVPLNEEAATAVRAWVAVRPNGGGDTLFTGKGSAALTPRGVQHRLKALGRAANVVVTPHMLRHTFANRLAQEKGVPLDALKNLLGHSDLRSTLIYTRPTADQLRRAVA